MIEQPISGACERRVDTFGAVRTGLHQVPSLRRRAAAPRASASVRRIDERTYPIECCTPARYTEQMARSPFERAGYRLSLRSAGEKEPRLAEPAPGTIDVMQQGSFRLGTNVGPVRGISPFLELGAYETLWAEAGATWKRIADRFRAEPGVLPSDLVDRERALATAREVVDKLKASVPRFGVRVHGEQEYPVRLRDAAHPVELLYFTGSWDFVESRCIAIVGTRNPSEDGKRRARKLVKMLVEDDWTIVSGLATGIDTVAHTTALENSGRTVAVIGTPLSETYPKENSKLQQKIAQRFLVISQVPVVRYGQQIWKQNRAFFPERNITMSALTEASVIVEASDTSGTLTQARAALNQGRKLFILDSCFENPDISWPAKFEEKGAIRVRDFGQIRDVLSASAA